MSEKREKPTAAPKAGTNRQADQPTKKPYSRPVLFVIGKIGQIVSNN